MTAAADRHLLFGLLALQTGIINQGQLVAAFQAWTLDKSLSLADHLEARGDLNRPKRAALEALAAVHVETHGGDLEESLAAIPANRSIRASLVDLGEPEIEATLAHVARAKNRRATEFDGDDDPERTAGLSVVGPTSDGQRFRILRPHARGGLGEVFVALDAELHREVALKQILEKHADDPVSRQRFVAEAEITGGLEHPGVVPVYGLGTYGGGRPYYAMRFIRGDSLKEAIERFHTDSPLPMGERGRRPGEGSSRDPGCHSLELRKLLRRFLDVCNAIDYAHSRGVLHRDIKPGNIIVGKHGETLVVDWGLAKATGKSVTSADERTLILSSASGSAETLPGSALGTPAYMSPEQARGEIDNLGPRSDVYSLGATLYCLLTGKAPQEGDDVAEMLRRVQRGEVNPPRQLDASIDEPLEAICLKAMAAKPEDRYASARALAEDVERWMADEPVAAYREPWIRTLTRWLTRHRTGVTGVAAAGLALLAGLAAVALVQAQARAALTAKNTDLEAASAKVQARYDLAVDAIQTFHTGVSEDFLLKQDQFKELRDRLLKSAADFYIKLSALLGQDSALEARRALAASSFELAELTGKVGRKEDALAAHRGALAARETLATGPGADPALTAEVARSLTAIAVLLDASGKADEALATYRRSEALLEGLVGSERSARGLLAACRARLGYLLYRTGKAAEALKTYTLARSDQEALAAAPGATIEARSELADTMQRIGVLLAETGNMSAAESEHRAALAIQQKLARLHPDVTAVLNRLALVHNSLGKLLSDTGKAPAAATEYRSAIALQSKLAERNPGVNEFRSSLALSHHNLAWLLSGTGKLSEAEAEYRAALAIQRKLADDNPAVTEYRTRLALTQSNLGFLLCRTGKLPEAKAQFLESLAIRQKLADDHPAINEICSDLAASHTDLGFLFTNTGKLAEADAEYRKSLAVLQKLADDNPTVTELQNDFAGGHGNLGDVLQRTGKTGEAETEFRMCLAIYRKLARDNPAVTQFRTRLAMSHSNLALLLTDTGKRPEAEAEYREAVALHRKLVEENPGMADFRRRLSDNQNNIGLLLQENGKLSKAEAEIRAALRLRHKLADDNPRVVEFRGRVAQSHSNLGYLMWLTGKARQAKAEYREALAIQERLAAENPEEPQFRGGLATSHTSLGRLLASTGEPSQALAECRKALTLRQKLVDDNPREVEGRLDLASCYTEVSRVLRRLRRPVEARDGCARAIAIAEKLVREVPKVPSYRSRLASSYLARGMSRADLGDFAGAAGDARKALVMWDGLASWTGEEWFEAASARAALANLAGRPGSGVAGAEASAQADAAMTLLRKAVAAGHRDADASGIEDAFGALRGRDDFKLVMMDLSFPAEAFAIAEGE
jgi:serine/threonine-protein kinase